MSDAGDRRPDSITRRASRHETGEISRSPAVARNAVAVVVVAILLASPAAGLALMSTTQVLTGDVPTSSATLLYDAPSGTDRLLLVTVAWDDANNANVTSATYASQDLTCQSPSRESGNVGVTICHTTSPPSGEDTLAVDWSDGVDEHVVAARTLQDVDQNDPIGATLATSGTDATVQSALSTEDPDSVIATAAVAEDESTSLSPISGTTEDHEDSVGTLGTGITTASGRANTTTTTSYDVGWDASQATPWGLVAVEVKRVPEQVSFDASSSNGSESTTSPSLTVTLDRSSSESIDVDYGVDGGNASSADYNFSSGTLTIPAGSTSGTIGLEVTQDDADEPDETVDVSLSNPVGGALGSPTTHTYTITDDDPNHAPSPSADSFSTDEDTSHSSTLSASDQDQGDTVDSFTVDRSPNHGTVSLDGSTGDFTYTPDADYNGADNFTFTATDNHDATSANATVDVTVNAVDDAPSASDDSATTDEDDAVWIDVLGDDTDVEGDSLSVDSTTTPSNGATSVPGNGTVKYTPDADYNGDDSFDYTVTDGTATSTATVNVTVNAVNDAPSASDDSASANPNATVWVNVLANDADVEGDSLSVSSATDPSNGATTVPGNGTVAYTADAGFTGTDTFDYTVSDGTDSVTASVSVTVSNPIEVLSSDVRVLDGSLTGSPTVNTTAMGSSLNIQLENATGGIDLDTLGADSSTTLEVNLTVNNFTPKVLMGRTKVQDWSNSTNGNGTENVSLELDPISMAFIDDCDTYSSFMGYCGPSSVDNWPTSSSEDQADVAFDAALRVFVSDLSYLGSDEQSELSGGFLTTDAQAIGQMSVSGSDSAGGASLTMPVAGPHLLPNGTTNDGFFEARLPDALLSSWGINDTSALTGTYQGANKSVTVSDVDKGTLVSMDIHYSSGDVTVGEDTTAPTADAGANQSVDVGETVSLDGTSSTDNQGIDSYTWDLDDGNTTTGATPSHTYDTAGTYNVTLNVSDAAGNTDTDTVEITVGGSNGAPNPSDDSASTPADETVWIDVLGNDADPDGDSLSVSSATSPSNGSTNVPGNGTVAYTPDPGFTGTDTFDYTVTDGSATDTGTVTVTVGDGGGSGPSQVTVHGSSVRAVNGSLDGSPTVNTTAMGSSLNIQLENATGGIDLAPMGASSGMEIEINLTVENFTPTMLMGRARVVDWSNTSNENGTENVTLNLEPISMAFIDDCDTYSSFMGYCGPSSVDNWPTSSSEDQADVAFDAALRVFVSDLSYLGSDEQSELSGGFLTTDAQAIGQMNVSGSDSAGGASLTMPVAGPHLLPNGTTNDGFFEARLPDALLSSWGINDTSALTGTYQGANKSVTVSDVDKGTLVSMDIHYSSGDVTIGEDTTDPTADAGNDTTVTVGSSVSLDGSSSTDNQGVTSYTWDLGDNATATGETANHTYDETGTYQVTLNVSDAAGNTDTDTVNVTVEADDSGGGGGGGGGAVAGGTDETESEDETEETTTTETDDATEPDDGTPEVTTSTPGGSGDPADASTTEPASASQGTGQALELPRSVTGAQAPSTSSADAGSDGGPGQSAGDGGGAGPLVEDGLGNAVIVAATLATIVGFPFFAARRLT